MIFQFYESNRMFGLKQKPFLRGRTHLLGSPAEIEQTSSKKSLSLGKNHKVLSCVW
jgi:hypothetical protein